jgi:FkbM family methyltransferase
MCAMSTGSLQARRAAAWFLEQPGDLLARLDSRVAASAQSKELTPLVRRLRYRSISELYSMTERWNFSFRMLAKTFWGDRMTVVLPDVVSTSILRNGYHEEGLTRMLLTQLKAGSVFFDVGAHFGYFTLLAARLVGGAGMVHAFEPSSATFNILKTNTRSSKNVIANNVAVFRAPGQVSFKEYSLESSAYATVFSPRIETTAQMLASQRPVSVPAVSLDAYVEQTGSRPSFIKIDAESSELPILQGMSNVLSCYRPLLSLEVGDVDGAQAPCTSRELISYLLERGYRVFQHRSGKIEPHVPRDRYSYDNLLFVANS